MTRAACGSTSHFPRRPDCAARPEATTGGRYRRPGVDATLHRDHACIMPTTTRMRIVEKPWGRIDVPVAFGDLADPPLLVKFLFTSERLRSEEHTSELQSLMRISYAVFCLKKKNTDPIIITTLISDVQTLSRSHTKTH